MTDLRKRLEVANKLEPPEMWEEIQRRGGQPGHEDPHEGRAPAAGHRLLAGILAFAVFAAAGAFAWRSFDGATTRSMHHSPSPTPVSAPTSFVATLQGLQGQHNAIVIASTTHGVEKILHPLPWDGMNVVGTAIAPSGDVWVTLNLGPACSSDIEGCGPVPHSCRSEVVAINPNTAETRMVLQATSGEIISDAVPSPDGKLVAYLQGGCTTSFFNQWITVRELASGRTWRIGASLPDCHWLGSLSWSPDSSSLVTVYEASSTSHYDGPQGSCSGPRNAVMAVVPAQTSAGGLPGSEVPSDAGCEIDSVVAAGLGYAAIEQCGTRESSYGDGTVKLIRYSSSLTPVVRRRLGRCGDGSSIAADHSGRYLIASSYQFCNPPGTTNPKTYLFEGVGADTHVIAVRQGGVTNPDFLAWLG